MGRMARRVAALVGGAAIVTMVGLTASCAKEEEKAPETTDNDHHDDHVAGHACTATTGRADGEVDQPDRRQPVHAPGEGAAGADGHPWR